MLEINIVKYTGQLVRDSRIDALLWQDEPFWFSFRDPITENNDDFLFFLKEFSWVFTSFFMLIVCLSTEEEH